MRRLQEAGLPIFLDLKLHDIPNTVAGAVRALTPLGLDLMTIHMQGGSAMARAAREAAQEAAGKAGVAPPRIVGVTILTSLDGSDLTAMGVPHDPQNQVMRLAGLAHEAGLDGIVCSPAELDAVRAAYPKPFTLVVPGLRPAGAAMQDQKRVRTPEDAAGAGADVLVIGRPITGATDPAAAAATIAKSVTARLAESPA